MMSSAEPVWKKILLPFAEIVWALTDFVGCLLFRPKERADLMLSRLDGLGDFIVWQDSLRAFREKYAGRNVVLVCNKAFHELAAKDPFFTKIISFSRTTYLYPWRRLMFLRILRRTAFEEVISPNHGRVVERWEWIVKMSIGKYKIGMNSYLPGIMGKKKSKMNRYYTKLIDMPENPIHILYLHAAFVRSACQSGFQIKMPTLDIGAIKPVNGKPYIVFVLSAGDEFRCWPARNFSEVADMIETPIVLLGNGKLGDALANEFLQHVSCPERVIDMTNKTTVLEYIEMIANASLVLGNDSSAIHIAAARRVPSIAVTAGGNYGGIKACPPNYPYFLPYPSNLPDGEYSPIVVTTPMDCFGCGHRCIFPVDGVYACLKMIRVDQVKTVLENMMMKHELSGNFSEAKPLQQNEEFRNEPSALECIDRA
jgi:ADP-heptose:LPS heptosyltransferase